MQGEKDRIDIFENECSYTLHQEIYDILDEANNRLESCGMKEDMRSVIVSFMQELNPAKEILLWITISSTYHELEDSFPSLSGKKKLLGRILNCTMNSKSDPIGPVFERYYHRNGESIIAILEKNGQVLWVPKAKSA